MRQYSRTSGKVPGVRSCSGELVGRDSSYYFEQTEVLIALDKRKGSNMKERGLLMTAALELEQVFLILV